MAKLKINTVKDSAYLLSDIQTAFGGFEVVGDFKNWDPIDKYPKLIEIRLINIQKKLHLNVTKVNYCKNKNIFEIHVETVKSINRNYRLDYTDAQREGLIFPDGTNTEVEVLILIYNSDSASPEHEYTVCGVPNSGSLKFPPDEVGFVGFDPKRKKGNILVGG